MPEITVPIPASTKIALDAEIARTGGTASSIVSRALAQYLGLSIHTLFQSIDVRRTGSRCL